MSTNHQPYDDNERQQADVTARALGERPGEAATQNERFDVPGQTSAGDSGSQFEQTRRLGELLRADITGRTDEWDPASEESVRCSAQLRESVLAALDAVETTPASKPKSGQSLKPRNRTRTWAWGLVASVAVCFGGIVVWTQYFRWNQTWQLAEGVSANGMRLDSYSTGQPAMIESRSAERGETFAQNNSYDAGIQLQAIREGSDVQKRPSLDDALAIDTQGAQMMSRGSPRVVAPGTKNESKALTTSIESGEKEWTKVDTQGASLGGYFGYNGRTLDNDGNGPPSPYYLSDDTRFDPNRWGRGGRRNTANEQYRTIPENPFWRPIGERAMSTFSIDVDTASYANVRRFLNEGSLPPPEAVRLEEFINYFRYNYPQPEDGLPLAVDLKLFRCPWNTQHALLRVGLHGRVIETEKRPISNIVYLVDVSGSMQSNDKLPLLKRGLQMMVDHLSENDTVSIVTYAGDAGVRLTPTNGANKKRILDAIDSLQSGGSTNGAAGIEVAYELARQHFVKDGANRVILMTDGDLNVGITSDEALVRLIKEKAAGGVFLTVLGFGTGNLKDAKLEGLADNGNGIYGYIDSLGEAHKVLVEQMSGNLVTIAKDVKIQIEFNPAQVAGYRMIGYENRVMANEDFANDRKDAGDVGAGHTVTALYEIVPVGATLDTIDPSSPTLKYQTLDSAPARGDEKSGAEVQLTEAAATGELAHVSLRYKTPEGTESQLVEFTADAEVISFSQADSDCRFAAAVAAFGMRLRQSQYAGGMTFDAIAEIASAALGEDSGGYRAEFVDLVRRAKHLDASAHD